MFGEIAQTYYMRKNLRFHNLFWITHGLDNKPTDNFGLVVLTFPRAHERLG